MKVTIILTVYNKEAYLRRAFDALLAQKNTHENDYEVLVVNDGSDDNSANIIEEYLRCDKRVRQLTQSNQGLSMARNNGVAEAKGDYVWFVDADDVIATDSISSIVKAMESQPDLISIYAHNHDEDSIRNAIPSNIRNGRELLLFKMWDHCSPFYICKRSFLNDNNLHFMPGIFHEDSELTPRMLWYAQSVVVIPKALYVVFHVPNSITQIPKKKRAYDILVVAESLYHFSQKKVDKKDKELRRVYDYRISMIINDAFSVICHYGKDEQSKFNNMLYKKRFLFNSLKNAPLKYYIESCLFRIFTKHYVLIYQLMKGKLMCGIIEKEKIKNYRSTDVLFV